MQVIERTISEGVEASFMMPTSLEGRVALLRELKYSLLLNFIQLTRLIVGSGRDESQQRQAMMMVPESKDDHVIDRSPLTPCLMLSQGSIAQCSCS